MNQPLHLIPADLVTAYTTQVNPNLPAAFEALTDAALSTPSFSFYTSVASVFSSKIEGEDIELDSYVKHKRFGIPFLPDYTKKIDDLYDAYSFAQSHPLNPENIAAAHSLLSRHLVTKNYQGRFRNQNMFVSTPDGRLEYVAALPAEVPVEMEKFFADIRLLLQEDLNVHEAFYFAAMLHLVFVNIHPWTDGNGRSARLLEKWFLAEKLGAKAWWLQSEKFYYQQHDAYYANIRRLGLEYPELDYGKALPFLLMLPNSLNPL